MPNKVPLFLFFSSYVKLQDAYAAESNQLGVGQLLAIPLRERLREPLALQQTSLTNKRAHITKTQFKQILATQKFGELQQKLY